MAVRPVARAVVADEVRDAAQRDGGLELVRMAHDPVGHEPTIAAAGDPEPRAIDPRVLCDHGRYAVHDVDIVLAAPLVHDSPLELAAVAGGSARVGEEHRP